MKNDIAEILEELYDIMDRLEEAAEDDESKSAVVNEVIDLLSDACDKLEEA